jgi:5'-methylthioadenosine phosphorylase
MSSIGIIGGSGLDDPHLLKAPREIIATTPYGSPSTPLLCGQLEGRDVVLLSRHGRGHTIPPTQINNRANLFALKEQGCTHVLATAACGSLRAEIGRGHIVIPDQFIDFTRHRATSFYETFPSGIENARHTPMADPFHEEIRQRLLETGRRLDLPMHDGGTIVTIEGPRFSTRAESRMFRMWGADLINMTVAPEAILANELGVAYAVIAVVTDYDCWKEDEPALSMEDLVSVFNSNVSNLTQLILEALPKL